MGKGKPRHKPNKPQNNYGGDGKCPYWDQISGNPSDGFTCEAMRSWCENCDGNLHKCKKAKYKYLASLKDKEKPLRK